MALILCIETATEVCSVALAENGKTVASEENYEGNVHASQLTVLIDKLVKQSGYELKSLDAIAVSKGPGSYTGLRVGVSTAKGLCYGLDKPLIAINTLESLARHFVYSTKENIHNASLVPMLDARRMEVYCAVFNDSVEEVEPTSARVIDDQSFVKQLGHRKVFFFGNGAAKCKAVIQHPNAIFIDNITCSAIGIAGLAEQYFVAGQFEDVAYFEPFYLKDFVGTTPRKLI